MPDGQLIEFDHVTKRFGAVAAVSDLSARVNPGVVTGFLGPNGAGKTTTLRMLLGLERPTIGTTKIGGKRFSELRSPARVIGAMLEDPTFRGRRTVERHLIAAAKANGIELSRVGELISFVGLGDDVETRIAALSLGMRQRLNAATALIGDPGVLVLDEPANGLDPEGIRWMRTLIRGLADEGRTVLVSSHVLSEVEQTADEILVIAHGELKFAGTMEDLAEPGSGPVVVDAADRTALSNALHGAGFEFEVLRSGLTVRGSDAAAIGGITASAGVALTTLQQRGPTLEDVFLDLVNDRYVRAAAPDASPEAPEPAAVADDETTGPLASVIEPVEAVTETVEAVTEPVEEANSTADADPSLPTPPSRQRFARPGASGAREPSSGSGNPTDSTQVTEPVEAVTEPVEEADSPADADDPEFDEEPVSTDEPADEARPLPGIAGLAAVASLFGSPPPATDVADDADPDHDHDHDHDHEVNSSAHDDLDATRVIDTVPGNATDAVDKLFSPVTHEDAGEHESVEHESTEEDSAEQDSAEQDSAEQEAFDGETAIDGESEESDSAHEQH